MSPYSSRTVELESKLQYEISLLEGDLRLRRNWKRLVGALPRKAMTEIFSRSRLAEGDALWKGDSIVQKQNRILSVQ
jgi:hypothetical protein